MTINFGLNQKDTPDASPTQTNLNKETGQEKFGETCNATEALPETNPRPRPDPTSWPYGEMLTGVSGHFSAAHKSPEGQWHGHTWHVTAWFTNQHRLDARVLQAAFNTMIARYDHKELPDNLVWGEDLARELAMLVNCTEVEVSRPAEGIHARWKWVEQASKQEALT